jgi:hypothetical protein
MTMNNIKFFVRVKRSGMQRTQYVQNTDRVPMPMTNDRKHALIMGKLMAQDAADSIQSPRCIAELVAVQVAA